MLFGIIVLLKIRLKISFFLTFISTIDLHYTTMLKKRTSSHNQHEKLACTTTTSHNQHQKQPPQPQPQPNNPQTTKQTKNQPQKTTTQPTCAHKKPTTTTKRRVKWLSVKRCLVAWSLVDRLVRSKKIFHRKKEKDCYFCLKIFQTTAAKIPPIIGATMNSQS